MFGPTAHTAKTASASKIGIFALLWNLLRVQGSGMPRVSQGSGGFPSRLPTMVLSAFVTTLGVLAFASAPASAKTVHVYCEACSFKPTGAQALDEPSGIAVNNSTGDVYVVDKGHNRVEEFTEKGVFIKEFAPPGGFENPEAIAVDNSTNPLDPSAGDVYVTDVGHSVVDKFTASGTYLGQITEGEGGAPLGELYGVAVDPNGEVWVYQSNLQIDDYSDALVNEFLAAREAKPEGGPKPGFAVDSQDDLYVVNRFAYHVAKLSSAGAFLEEFGGENENEGTHGIAVSIPDGDVYLDQGTTVGAFSAGGSKIESFGAGHLTDGEGVAVNYSTGNAASGTVYVADSAGDDVAVFGLGVIPDVAVGPVSGFPSDTSATLTGTVGPDNTTVTGCEFEYVTESEFKEEGGFAAPGVLTVPCEHPDAAEIPADSEAHAVSATATGLTQGTTYYYRLSATNSNGTDSSSEGTFLQPYPVKVEGESSSFVETGAVTLEAKINPGGAETAYHFEYGPAAGDYDVSVPISDREIPAELHGVEVSARATGLAPSTTYHYRVVAANGLPGAVDGPDQMFTTLTPQGTGSPANCPNEQRRAEQPYGLGLPDCRAYEQVSPLNKEGGSVEDYTSRAAVSGGAIVYQSENSFSGPKGAQLQNTYLSRRGPDGWGTQNITQPIRLNDETYLNEEYVQMIFTPELTKGTFVQPWSSLSSDFPAGYNDLYVTDFAERSDEVVNNVVQPGIPPYDQEGEHGPECFGCFPYTSGGSVDFSHVVFSEEGALTPGASPNLYHPYEWVDGHLYQVDVPPAGTTFPNGGSAGAHGVSENGLRVVFAQEPEGGPSQVYVRENPEQPPVDGSECAVPADACTVQVSASQRKTADPRGPQPASFVGASANGSRVFFTSNAELTNNAYTGEEDDAANLYEYNFDAPEGKRLTDLTEDSEPADVKDGAAVEKVLDISEEGSYVYFVATGKLAGNENSHHDTAQSGERNLYLYHEGTVTFVATLSPEDLTDQVPTEKEGSKVSGDGTHLAFISERSLTGYDNQPLGPREGCGPEGCDEIYLFDASTGSLVCASCDPSGARPVGAAWLSGQGPRAFSPGPQAGDLSYVSRNLSEDGSQLFFDSHDPLLPHASNGLTNVYEYENGHLYLISDGAGRYESDFLDASANGKNVFFTTADGLLPSDQDERVDVYDARVEGGFPVPASPSTCDNGDSCKGPASPQPGVFGAPASATFSGPGNPPPPPPPVGVKKVTNKATKCKKHFAKNAKGRCVKKKTKRAKKSAHTNRRTHS